MKKKIAILELSKSGQIQIYLKKRQQIYYKKRQKNILKEAATNDPLPTAFLNISAFLEVEHSSKPRCTDH